MKLINNKILTIITLIAFVSLSYAGAILSGKVTARSNGENIVIEWRTEKEVNIKNFVIQRKVVNVEQYSDIAEMNPKGDNSYYQFVDETAYKSSDAIYVYRLKIVDTNSDISYSSEITVSHSVSGVKRTWGSIKAMFR